MCAYCPDLIEDFEDLADSLIPPDEFFEEVNAVAHNIFEHLKQHARDYNLSIARTIKGGSFGKGTCIGYCDKSGIYHHSDLDLTVVLNDEQPPFDNVYDKMESIFLDRKLEGLSWIKVRDRSILLKVWTPSFGEIKVDLLAAENHVKISQLYRGHDIAYLNAKFSQLYINPRDQDQIYLRNTACTENHVKSIRNLIDDDKFTLSVILIAKFWLKYGGIFGTSCLVEAIAIWAQQWRRSARNGRDRCLISGFRRFLEAVSGLGKLRISVQGADSINDGQPSPVVQDLGNPLNNLASRLSPEDIHDLEQQAKKTLRILRKVRNLEGYNMYDNVRDAIFSYK